MAAQVMQKKTALVYKDGNWPMPGEFELPNVWMVARLYDILSMYFITCSAC